jgi:translation initiation factor 2 subunit 2
MQSGGYEDLLKRAKANLPKTVEAHERFQIPQADIQIEGKTTILRNFIDICEVINRSPDQVLAYLLREIGTAGVLEDRRVVFKGKVTATQVQDRIQGYVDNYVLCTECNRPDTRLVKEGRVAILECDACGARRSVRAIKKQAKVEEVALEEGKVYELMIQDIGRKGDGIAKKDRYIIYVPGTTKGSVAKIYIEKITGTVAFGHVVRE